MVKKGIIRLDVKDKKLLFELDMDARQTNAQIAKKIGLSKQSVQYRINRLIKQGVIKGFYPVINVPKLGYIYCRFSVSLKDATEEETADFLRELKSDKRFFWIFTTQGIYDALLVAWTKNIDDFRKISEELLIKYGKIVKSINQTIATDVIHYQHRYIRKVHDTKEIHIRETIERVEIDELDKKILVALSSNGRASLVELSRELKESAKVISYRIKRMEKQKLIEGYRSIIDHKKLGYTYYKLWIDLHNFSKESLFRIRSFVKNDPATIYEVKGIGLPEFLDIEIMVPSSVELFEFIKRLKREFPRIVGNYRSFIFIDTIKVKYYPF